MLPLFISSRMVASMGMYRVQMASVMNTPRRSASANTSRACLALAVKAFSHRTGLPARIHNSALAQCSEWGVAMYTSSTCGSAASSS